MFNENDIFKCDCVDLDIEGNGVCKVDDFVFFVKGPLKGERVEIKVDKLYKNFGFATMQKRFTTSPYRANPKCPFYDLCGGCNLMHFSYNMHSDYKKHIVKTTLNKIGKIECNVNDVIMMEDYKNYRNNIQVSFSKKDGKILAGFYSNKTHNVVDMDKCLIAPSISDRIIPFLKSLFKIHDVSIYNPKTKQGCIKQVIIRVNNKSEVMLVFVTNTNMLEKETILVSELTKKFTKIVSIMHNVNVGDSPVHLGNETYLVYGSDYLTDELFGTKFEIGAESFFQVNHVQVEALYNKVFEYANLKESDVVIDAYCGIGTMSLLAAKLCKQVYGIEVVEEAIKNANRNKEINNISNVEFICGKAEEKIELLKDKDINCLIVDPPRKGCEKPFLDSIIGIEKIIYVSCNVATQARDLRYLVENGYEVLEATPVDMFPYTNHVECIVLLQKK